MSRAAPLRTCFESDDYSVSDLAEDLLEGRQKYIKKRDHFIALSSSFKDRVPGWEAMSRTPYKDGKEAVSVYKHSSTKGLSW